MADYQDRTREVITIITPAGTEYEARWRGNPRSLTNKIGIHEFPGIAGAKVQDLGVGAFIYPLTLYFDGPNSDLEAEGFMLDYRDQTGDWQIIHPVKGPIFLSKISAHEVIDPTTSGGLQTIETIWIEGLPDSEEESAAQLQAQAEFQAEEVNTTATAQFDEKGVQKTPGQVQSIITNIGKVISAVKQQLALIENLAILDPQITAIITAIQNTLSGDLIDTSLLAGQMQSLIQLFGLGQSSSTQGAEMYDRFIDDVLEIVPTQPTEDDLTGIATTEMVAMATVAAVGQVALIGGIDTREQAVTTAETVTGIFAKVTQALDEIQTLYNGQYIDQAYFSQTDTFASAYLSSQQSVKFLLTSLFGLPAERRIVIKELKATAQIAKDEYGSINTEDGDTFNLEKLISSNQLCCNELYLVEAGRELLIYQ